MGSEFQFKKPRKLTEEEITKCKKWLSAAEPYPDDYHVFDDPDWDPARELASRTIIIIIQRCEKN